MCLCVPSGFGQSPSTAKNTAGDRSAAYFNFTMGNRYSELAGAYGNRGDYVQKAIEHYKLAMKADPNAGFLLEELTELYLQAGQVRTAVTETEEVLKQNPDSLQARRILGRIYTRLIGDTDRQKINEEMLKKATEQYRLITAKDPSDAESWVTLGRLYRVSQNSVDARKAFEKAVELDARNEDALTGLAMIYSDLGDNKNMVEMLRRVAEISPNLRSLTQLGAAYEQMRDYASATEVFKRALEQNPDNTQVKRALAQNLLYSDQVDASLKLYLELAEAEPKDAQIQLRLAEIYRSKRDFLKARAALAKARELDKNSIEARYDEVNLLEAEGKTDEAITTLKAIVDETRGGDNNAAKGTRAMLLERLGGLYRANHQTPQAVESFRQAAELAPDSASRAAVQIVDTYRQAKDFKNALAEAKSAREKYPNERPVKVIYALLLADVGRVPEAAVELKSLPSGSKDRELYLTLAQVYEKGKDYPEMEKAIGEAEKLSESKADKETIYFMRGAMYEKMKKFDQAETEFRKVLAVNPQSSSAMNYLGYMLADRNSRLDEARDLLHKAIELDPFNGAYLDSLGWVYYRLNKLDEAENYLRRSLERIQGDPTVHDHLGDVYLKQGKLKEAIGQWQLSLREWESSAKADVDEVEVAKVTKKLEGARVRLAREGTTR